VLGDRLELRTVIAHRGDDKQVGPGLTELAQSLEDLLGLNPRPRVSKATRGTGARHPLSHGLKNGWMAGSAAGGRVS